MSLSRPLSRPFRQGAAVDDLVREGGVPPFHPHMRQRIPAGISHVYGLDEPHIGRCVAPGRARRQDLARDAGDRGRDAQAEHRTFARLGVGEGAVESGGEQGAGVLNGHSVTGAVRSAVQPVPTSQQATPWVRILSASSSAARRSRTAVAP